MAVRVAFWFDVEDYISPRADDALKLLLEAFEKRNLKATWKLVGEKLRVLEARGRADIIAMVSAQDIGYHTDYHSVHPTVTEYCEAMSWDEGAAEFELREGAGLEHLVKVFGRIPSTYGQPGGAWAAQAYPVLRKWGIPTYIDEVQVIGLHNQPFHYCGLLNVLNLGPNCHRTSDWTDAAVGEAISGFTEAVARLEARGGGLLQVYYHPCEFSCDEFWDGANFSRGANPPRDKWVLPLQNSDEEMHRRVRLFEEFLDGVVSSGAELVTARDLAGIYADASQGLVPSEGQLRCMVQALSAPSISPAIGDGLAFSPAECFQAAVELLADCSSAIRCVLGPRLRPEAAVLPATVRSSELVSACGDVTRSMKLTGHIPSAVLVGSLRLAPADFARTIAQLCTLKLDHQALPEWVPALPGSLALEPNISGEGAWDWVIFPSGFEAPAVVEAGRLQVWTLKPALVTGGNSQ